MKSKQPGTKPAEPSLPEIAYTEVQLPSRGRLYGPNCSIKTPPIPEGRVSIRKMMIAEIDILAGNSGTAYSRVSKLLAKVVKLPDGFDPEHLLADDRVHLLIATRMHTFGPVFDVQFKCPHCSHANKKRPVNLVETLNETELPEGVIEPIEVKLPDFGATVGVRLLRGVDEAAAIKDARDASTRGLPSTPLQDNLKRVLLTLDGEPFKTPFEKMDLVRRLSANDLYTIRDELDRFDFGVNTEVHLSCERCEADVELDLPFGVDFFRPSTHRP